MKINRYEWEEEGAPILPNLDAVIQKFDRVIVVTSDRNNIIGYSGFEERETRHIITSFWVSPKYPSVNKMLIEELKKEVGQNKQKRIGMVVEATSELLIKLLGEADWSVVLPDKDKFITTPGRACYQVRISDEEIQRMGEINERKRKTK